MAQVDKRFFNLSRSRPPPSVGSQATQFFALIISDPFQNPILIESPSCAPVRIGDLLQARVPVAVPAPSFSDNPSGPATPHYSRSSFHDTHLTPGRGYVPTGTRPEHAPRPANPPSPAQ